MTQPDTIQMIPVAHVNILNPRVRNRKIFIDIKENIVNVGLKRPITVTPSSSGDSSKPYDLVCGQGRLEAFLACNQSHIPAVVIQASEEQALVMSLVENLARKQHRSIDLLKGITQLQQRGYDARDISLKTGLSQDYTYGLLNLIERGEERLLTAVDTGAMPITVAVQIALSPGNEQQALQDAYENKLLRGHKLITARRLVEARRLRGKAMLKGSGAKRVPSEQVSAKELVKVYQKEVDRKKSLVRKADTASRSLVFVIEALRRLLKEEAFTAILVAEGLTTLPQTLASIIHEKA